MVQRIAAETGEKYNPSNSGNIRQMNFTYPYRAIICGEEHIVEGWQGNKLITDLGEFFVSHIYGDWQLQTQRIFEVATIQSDGKGDWLVNGKLLSNLKAISMNVRFSEIPKNETLRVHKKKICAAAWIETGQAPNVTELLDEIARFWKAVSLPVVKPDAEEPHWARALDLISRGLFDIQTYKELFPTWSKPIWLTEFRVVGQITKPVEVEVISSQLKYIPTVTENKILAMQTPKMITDVKKAVESDNAVPEFFFSIESAAKYIGVSGRTVLNWKKREWLKVEQNGKKIRIARTDLDKCKNRQ